MHSRFLMTAFAVVLVATIAACSSSGASTAPASLAPASVSPCIGGAARWRRVLRRVAPAAASGATVEAKPVGSIGTVLVAGSNGMTVYNFEKDTKDSGKSACTGGCLDTWPALTVPAGGTPTAGGWPDRQARDDHP